MIWNTTDQAANASVGVGDLDKLIETIGWTSNISSDVAARGRWKEGAGKQKQDRIILGGGYNKIMKERQYAKEKMQSKPTTYTKREKMW